MAVLAARGDPPPPEAIAAAVAALAAGRVVGLPTDTVYGLAAGASCAAAIARIYDAKGRPDGLALPVLVTGSAQAAELVKIDGRAEALMGRFWPGALTIVLPARGRPGTTVGVRAPHHPVALALCAAAGPLAATSANRHGEPPAVTAAEVVAVFGPEVDPVLDAGRSGGRASTVVDATGRSLRLLREGAVAWPAVLAAAAPKDL